MALGLSNSLLSLIVVYPTITVPFSAWLLMGFFKSIPPETEEAALCDGYHPYGAFLRVALPLARPGIISVIVFSFTLTLHEFIYALVFITRSEWRTLSVGVPSELILGDVFFWQPLLASALIVAIPVGPDIQRVPRPPDPGLHRRRRQGLALTKTRIKSTCVPYVRNRPTSERRIFYEDDKRA